MKHSFYRFFTIAVTLHLVVLFGAMLVLPRATFPTQLPPSIPTMLYQSSQHEKSVQAIQKPSKIGLLKKSLKQISTPSTFASLPSQSTHHSLLLEKLHNAIAQYENLPEGITTHHQVVTLGMNVSPDGTLSDVKVLHSSGNELLDELTVQAAKAASPVAGIGKILPKQEFFSVDIIYT